MKIKIKCDLCKDESLLLADPILDLHRAEDVIKSITEVIERHEKHAEHLDFWVYENEDDPNIKRFVYNALRSRLESRNP